MSDDEEDSFVDARLYITIRPALEYRIIENGQRAIACMVGDEEEGEDLTVRFTGVSSPSSTQDSFASVDDARLDAVCSLCMSVCSLTEEHLRHMEMEWIEFLTRVHSGLRNELRGVRSHVAEVQRVREQYGPLNNAEVNGEIAREMQGLDDRMEEILARYRAADAPRVQRSEEFRAATVRLRTEFGNMYGIVPTRTLSRVKQIFERELESVQATIAQSFNRRLRELLKRPL